MPFNLPAMARRAGRRRSIALRPINPTQAQANDLARLMAPAWQLWASGIDRILAGYDPPPLTTDALIQDSISDIAQAINEIANDFLARLVVDIVPNMRRWTVRSEQIHRSRWIAAVNAGAGVDISAMLTSLGTEETVAAFLERMTALVKDVSAQAQGKISDAVYRGYQQRLPVREVAKEIREASGFARARSIRIASDQNSKLSAALDTERQVEAGLDAFKWRHSGKLHPRSWHQARDGKVYEIKSGKQVGGDEVVPANDRPGMAPFCGCRAQAWIPLMDEMS